MCDETGGNCYWQFLFLFPTHTQTQTKTKTFGLPHLAPPAVCELVLAAKGQARPPPTPTPTPQCKLKALLATQHICSSYPWDSSIAHVQLGIRDLRSECHMNVPPTFWSAEREVVEGASGWVCKSNACTSAVENKPHNKYVFAMAPYRIISQLCTEMWVLQCRA